MSKSKDYQRTLRTLEQWDDYLLRESGLPGPRANLELVQAVADAGDEALFLRLLTYTPEKAPAGSQHEFLPVCGVVGLGRLLAEGRTDYLSILRGYASDPRWRMREGVAMALQRYGDCNMPGLIGAMATWSKGTPLEQRAAAAALCEPRLLKDRAQVKQVLAILDDITASMAAAGERKRDDYQTLRKAMGYCWSVAVAASPQDGKRSMQRWFASPDKDVRWVMRENLKKDRLLRMDRAWVEKWQAALALS